MELTEGVVLDPAMLAIAATCNEGESHALSLARLAWPPLRVAPMLAIGAGEGETR